MANFVATTQWNFNLVNLNFYIDNLDDVQIQQDGSFSFNGQSYPDYFFATASDATRSLRFDLYGQNIEVSGLGTPTSGEINAAGEFDVSGGSPLWYMDDIQLSAVTTFNAALSEATSDDVAVIQSAFAGNDTITMSEFNDVMFGFGGADRMTGAGGNDQMDGGQGSDTAVYSQPLANYTITYNGTTATVNSALEGTDTLTNFEFLEFGGQALPVNQFFVDTSPPTISGFQPGNGSESVEVGTNLVLTFSESITLGAGTIEIRKGLASGPIVESFNVSSSSQVTVSGNVLTINPTSNLSEGSQFHVILGAGVVKDSANNAFGGSSSYSFSTAADAPANQAPVAADSLANATENGPVVTGQLEASDANGDNLIFTQIVTGQSATGVQGLSVNANGSWSFNPNHTSYAAVAAGTTVSLIAAFSVSDGELNDSGLLTITLTGVNDAPVFSPSNQTLVVQKGVIKSFSVFATDVEGDPLSFSAADPAHGAVTGGANGQFTYSPDAGFAGTDTINVTVSDGKGGSATIGIVVNVSDALTNNWQLVSSSGLVANIGFGGQVFGTEGYQQIKLLDLPGTIEFDPSFNKGGDIVRLAGEANDWTIARSGSSAILSDGDTIVRLPVGPVGMAVVFDDGARKLVFDQALSSLRIGSQTFSFTAVQIGAAIDNTVLPSGANPNAAGSVVMAEGGEVRAGGNFDIVGTSGAERIDIIFGDITLDPSFNKGGDTVLLAGQATSFTALRIGSSVFLDSSGIEILAPVGPTGMNLIFEDSDSRLLLVSASPKGILLGDQLIGFDPIVLAAA